MYMLRILHVKSSYRNHYHFIAYPEKNLGYSTKWKWRLTISDKETSYNVVVTTQEQNPIDYPLEKPLLNLKEIIIDAPWLEVVQVMNFGFIF